MGKKRQDVHEEDSCDASREIRATRLILEGRMDELTEEEYFAVTKLFDLPPSRCSLTQIESLLKRTESLASQGFDVAGRLVTLDKLLGVEDAEDNDE